MLRAHGVLRVTHGPGRAARVLARVFARALRLPPAGAAVDTRLVVTTADGCDHWQRTFDGCCLDSRQYARGADELIERFRHLEFRFRRETAGAGTVFRQLGAALRAGPLRVPLPRRLAPRVDAREDVMGPGRRYVDVRVTLPGFGTLLTYDGALDVEVSDQEPG
jgi:hypothetical protein